MNKLINQSIPLILIFYSDPHKLSDIRLYVLKLMFRCSFPTSGSYHQVHSWNKNLFRGYQWKYYQRHTLTRNRDKYWQETSAPPLTKSTMGTALGQTWPHSDITVGIYQCPSLWTMPWPWALAYISHLTCQKDIQGWDLDLSAPASFIDGFW